MEAAGGAHRSAVVTVRLPLHIPARRDRSFRFIVIDFGLLSDIRRSEAGQLFQHHNFLTSQYIMLFHLCLIKVFKSGYYTSAASEHRSQHGLQTTSPTL